MMSISLENRSIGDLVDQFPVGDRWLVTALCVLGLVSLLLGLAYALGMVLGMTGVLGMDESLLYKLLTLHATTAFYYWLYFVQAGVILALVGIYTPAVDGFRWRHLGWIGCGLMACGLVLNQVAAVLGAALTYVGLASLAAVMPHAGPFYLGYLSLAVGLGCLAVVGIGTAIEQKRRGDRVWPSLLFASVLWWGLVLVSVIASVNAYLPPMLTAVGVQVRTAATYTMNWAVLFHNMHYLPLVSAVIVWYVVAEAATGVNVKRVFSSRFSKVIFAIYLVLVPPTSLYHMFLSPSVSPAVKTIGSLLALGMSLPTVLHFLVIVSTIETGARSQGNGGWVRWIRHLPWNNPAVAAVGWAIVCAAGGGILSNVLVQHGFASLLSDTFFVPAYFHFFTAGTVTLTFLGMLAYLLPALTGAQLSRPGAFTVLPAVATAGIYVFGIAGVVGGYLGLPRRTLVGIDNAGLPVIWSSIVLVVAAGGVLMAVSLGAYAGGLLLVVGRSLPRGEPSAAPYPSVDWGDEVTQSATVVSGVVTVGILLIGWVVMTILTDLVIEHLPVALVGIVGGSP